MWPKNAIELAERFLTEGKNALARGDRGTARLFCDRLGELFLSYGAYRGCALRERWLALVGEVMA
jgi:hypothetical protein